MNYSTLAQALLTLATAWFLNLAVCTIVWQT